jgi:hypothetical protein
MEREQVSKLDMVQSKNSTPTEQLGRDLGGLLSDETFADVTFYCGEDQEPIKAHKNILAFRCLYFQKMFTLNMKEKNINDIHLPHIQRMHFFEIIRFIYTAEATLDIENISFIYALADQYVMDNLKEYCLNFPITSENFFPILNSCKFGAEPLYQKAILLLESGEMDLLTLFEGANFLKLSKDILIDILKQNIGLDDLTIFNYVIKWAKHQVSS